MVLRLFFCAVVLFSFNFANAQNRVVSLSPIVTKTIHMIGAEDRLVACTKWCPNDQQIPIVADAINVNIEALLKVKPDLVFASTLVSAESIKTIKSLGIELVVMPRMDNFEVMCNNVLLIGEKMACNDEAHRQVNMALERLHLAKESIDTTQQRSVLLQIGAKPIFVAIPHTFVDDYIQQSGAVNCFSDMEHGTVSRESVILRNPDAIFMSIMPALAEQEKMTWRSFNELRAAHNNMLYILDQDKTSAPTIHDFVDVVAFMIDVLYQ